VDVNTTPNTDSIHSAGRPEMSLVDAGSCFLSRSEVAELTGRKMKSRQVAALRKMGIAFFVNPSGRPIVSRAAIEGARQVPGLRVRPWTPNIAKG
jgi:uncharacterized protein DUF4224